MLNSEGVSLGRRERGKWVSEGSIRARLAPRQLRRCVSLAMLSARTMSTAPPARGWITRGLKSECRRAFECIEFCAEPRVFGDARRGGKEAYSHTPTWPSESPRVAYRLLVSARRPCEQSIALRCILRHNRQLGAQRSARSGFPL
jgi:hypothetical protein